MVTLVSNMLKRCTCHILVSMLIVTLAFFLDGINLMDLLPMLKPSQLALHSLTSPVASFLVHTVNLLPP